MIMRLRNEIHIKNLNLDDMGSVFELGQGIFDWPTERVLWNERTVRWYFEYAKAVSFVAKNEKSVIGFILCFVVGATGRVEWIAVESEFRHQGVANALLRRVLLVFRLNKVTEITTLSREDGCANQFFIQNGFRERGLRKTELILAPLDSTSDTS